MSLMLTSAAAMTTPAYAAITNTYTSNGHTVNTGMGTVKNSDKKMYNLSWRTRANIKLVDDGTFVTMYLTTGVTPTTPAYSISNKKNINYSFDNVRRQISFEDVKSKSATYKNLKFLAGKKDTVAVGKTYTYRFLKTNKDQTVKINYYLQKLATSFTGGEYYGANAWHGISKGSCTITIPAVSNGDANDGPLKNLAAHSRDFSRELAAINR